MPVEVDLSPKATEKVAREAAVQSFDNAARSIAIEWRMDCLDGKQVRRWSQKLGKRVVKDRQRAVEAYERGERQACKANDPQLLVIEIDGWRVQNRLKNEDGSRWREDKLVTVSTVLRGNPKTGKKSRREPKMLVTTHVAAMGNTSEIGKLARVEAEKRMLCQAREVVVLGDGAAWIDGVCEDHFPCHARIVDYPEYRRRGWPIGSGTVESGMKQLNKRMKGTDQFWNTDGAESILALRGQWLSQDGRWEHYWLCADPGSKAA